MIHTVDCHYLGYPEFAAVYLLQSQGEWTVVDTNTRFAVPRILEALKKAGALPAAVRYIVITHVHLDHAGGTAELLKHCPNAVILAHPRSLRHLTDPTRLTESAKRVYGEKEFMRLYGTIEPIAAARIRTVDDDERVDFGSSAFRFLHTLGHAKHHACAVWEETGEVFTGDAFGLRYPALSKKGDFVFASTSPVDFNGRDALASVERIRKLMPRAVYPTHYGKVTEVAEAANQLQESIRFAQEVSHVAYAEGLRGPRLIGRLSTRLGEWMREQLAKRDLELSATERKLLQLDIDVNAQGLAFALEKA